MFITLSNGKTIEVPEGAEPEAFKRWQEAKLRLQGKSSRKAGSRTRRNSRKTNYAQQVLLRDKATLELVERVNNQAQGD